MADFRALPSVDAVLQRPAARALVATHGRHAAVHAIQSALGALRGHIGAGETIAADGLADAVVATATSRLDEVIRGSLRSVVNATGVVVHTNLGRAPLADAALARVMQVGRGYATIEYDLAAGRRGSRSVHAEGLLAAVTGAEAAVVVNNNAAAMLLVLSALAHGREVLISRGELVEIGGGFRVPDVMAQSGARLREVGTTNRTRVSDYTAAIGPSTALLLRVHPSNFRIEGFTERPDLGALVTAAHERGLPIVEDLGSGNLDPGLAEPTVQASLAAGVDVVCVSGDKMLGGPQAGIVLGRKALVDTLRRHPLMRALRVDKLTYAALEGTLVEHLAGRAAEHVPVVRMLHVTVEAIRQRAERLAQALVARGWQATVVDGHSAVGGGSAPGLGVPTALVQLAWPGWSADRLETWLRQQAPPIIARIHDDAVVLDLRTVSEDEGAGLSELQAPPARRRDG